MFNFLDACHVLYGSYVSSRIKKAKVNIYDCPNCSHSFKATWKQISSNIGASIRLGNNINPEMIRLKCPECNQVFMKK